MVESSDDQIELGEHVIFISMYRDRSIYWGWPLYRYIAGGIYIDVYIYMGGFLCWWCGKSHLVILSIDPKISTKHRSCVGPGCVFLGMRVIATRRLGRMK